MSECGEILTAVRMRQQRYVARVSTQAFGLVDGVRESRPAGDGWTLVAFERRPDEFELVWEREVQIVPPRHWRSRLRRPRLLRGA